MSSDDTERDDLRTDSGHPPDEDAHGDEDDDLPNRFTVGSVARATAFHTRRCRHVRRSDNEPRSVTDAVIEFHDLGHCPNCADDVEYRNGEMTLLTDGGAAVPEPDITKFQLRILGILVEEARYGLAVKRELEAYYGEEVNHGRLYPNLDDLVERGLVEKSQLDRRTNEYAATDSGRLAVGREARWLVERYNGGGDDA